MTWPPLDTPLPDDVLAMAGAACPLYPDRVVGGHEEDFWLDLHAQLTVYQHGSAVLIDTYRVWPDGRVRPDHLLGWWLPPERLADLRAALDAVDHRWLPRWSQPDDGGGADGVEAVYVFRTGDAVAETHAYWLPVLSPREDPGRFPPEVERVHALFVDLAAEVRQHGLPMPDEDIDLPQVTSGPVCGG